MPNLLNSLFNFGGIPPLAVPGIAGGYYDPSTGQRVDPNMNIDPSLLNLTSADFPAPEPKKLGFLGTLGQVLRGENDMANIGLGIATANGGFGEAIRSGILGAQRLRMERDFTDLRKRLIESQIQGNNALAASRLTTPPVIRNDANGVPRYVTGPIAGQPVFPNAPKDPTLPDDKFVNVNVPNVGMFQFRQDDPQIDELVRGGARVVPDDAQRFTDPVSGQQGFFVPSTGETIYLTGGVPNAPASPGTPAQPQPADTGSSTLLNDPNFDILEEATGPLDYAAGVLERVPVLSGLVEGEDERQANQYVNSIKFDIERAFAKNPRYAEGEVKRVNSRVGAAFGALSTSSAGLADLQALDTTLAGIQTSEQSILENPQQPPEARKAAAETINNIQQARAKIKNVITRSEANIPRVKSAEEARKLPPGTIFMTPDGRRMRVPK